MIGRGAFGNPWLFAEAKAALDGEAIPPRPPLASGSIPPSRSLSWPGGTKGKDRLPGGQKHFAWYLKGVRHAGYFREKISRIETLDDIYAVADTIKRD